MADTPHLTSAPPVTRRGIAARLPSLTGMRFLAAMMVFLFHSSRVTPPLSPFRCTLAHWYSAVLTQAGWLGVSFFFVLSGFVLTWVARSDDSPRRFWRRRAAKIYPNQLVTFTVTMLLLTSAAPWRQWLPNLLLIQTWFPTPHLNIIFSIDQPNWSLSCEIIFYLCFPWLYRVLCKLNPATLWAWAGGAVAAIFAVATVAQFVLPSAHMVPAPGGPIFSASEWQVWVVYALPPVRMLEFILGMLLARIVLTGRWINLPLVPAIGLTLGAYVVASEVPLTYSAVAVCVAPLGLLIASVAAADASGRRSPFRGRVLVWLGEVSYAFYLVHGIVIGYARFKLTPGATYSGWTAAGYVVAEFAVAVFLSWLLYALVEKPVMRRWSRSPSERRRSPAQAGPAPEAGSPGAVPSGTVPAGTVPSGAMVPAARGTGLDDAIAPPAPPSAQAAEGS